jgi:hypothetical protein
MAVVLGDRWHRWPDFSSRIRPTLLFLEKFWFFKDNHASCYGFQYRAMKKLESCGLLTFGHQYRCFTFGLPTFGVGYSLVADTCGCDDIAATAFGQNVPVAVIEIVLSYLNWSESVKNAYLPSYYRDQCRCPE